MKLREWVHVAFPKASDSHQWAADGDGDNIECVECGVRPYNHDAWMPCPGAALRQKEAPTT